MTEMADFSSREYCFVTKILVLTWNMYNVHSYAHGADDGRNGDDGVGGWTSDVETRYMMTKTDDNYNEND